MSQSFAFLHFHLNFAELEKFEITLKDWDYWWEWGHALMMKHIESVSFHMQKIDDVLQLCNISEIISACDIIWQSKFRSAVHSVRSWIYQIKQFTFSWHHQSSSADHFLLCLWNNMNWNETKKNSEKTVWELICSEKIENAALSQQFQDNLMLFCLFMRKMKI